MVQQRELAKRGARVQHNRPGSVGAAFPLFRSPALFGGG